VTRRILLLLCILGSSSTAFAQTWSTVSLATRDLAYSPLTQRLYATTPVNNSVQEIDPLTGTLLRSLFVGSQPNKLAISDTGSHLYVGLDGAAQVARVNLVTFTVDLQFALGSDSFSGPFLAQDLAVQPGNPNVVAVVRKPGNSSATAGVAIFDSGVIRPNATSDFYTVTELEFSATPSRLYGYNDFTTGYDFSRLTVDGAGVTLNDSVGNLIQGFYTDIRFDAGRVYGSDGRVIDPETRLLLGTFPLGNPFRALVAPSTATGVVHFVTQTLGGNWELVLRRFRPDYVPAA
jgi:DNA-binding beta-propeller fold protein YncE